jgi:hypothetical protein
MIDFDNKVFHHGLEHSDIQVDEGTIVVHLRGGGGEGGDVRSISPSFDAQLSPYSKPCLLPKPQQQPLGRFVRTTNREGFEARRHQLLMRWRRYDRLTISPREYGAIVEAHPEGTADVREHWNAEACDLAVFENLRAPKSVVAERAATPT